MNWCLDANSAMKPNLLTHLMPLIFLYFPVSIRRRFSDVFMAYQKIPLALTHYSPVLLNYTPWRKHLLVKLSAISRQACNFTKNELLYTYFSKILAIFYITIYCFRTPRTLIFSKHLSIMVDSVSTCINSHMFFIFTVHYYSLLPFLYNRSHRLNETFLSFIS